MKWSSSGFQFPTPARIRVWAKAFNVACGSTAVVSFAHDVAWFGSAVVVIGLLINFLAEGFHEGDNNVNTNTDKS